MLNPMPLREKTAARLSATRVLRFWLNDRGHALRCNSLRVCLVPDKHTYIHGLELASQHKRQPGPGASPADNSRHYNQQEVRISCSSHQACDATSSHRDPNACRACRYKGFPMILSYTANHYEDAFANHQTCAGINTPFSPGDWAYASQHTIAASERSLQKQVGDFKGICAIEISSASFIWMYFRPFLLRP